MRVLRGKLYRQVTSFESALHAALSLVTPIEMAVDGFTTQRARIELLRLPTWDAAGLANEAHITFRAFRCTSPTRAP